VRAFTHCPNCGFEYLITLIRAPTLHLQQIRKQRRRLIRRSVGQFLLGAFVVQLVLCLLAMALRGIDQEEFLVTFFGFESQDGHPGTGDFMHAMCHYRATYYLAAVILSLVLLAFARILAACVQRCQVCGPCSCGSRCLPQEDGGDCCSDCLIVSMQCPNTLECPLPGPCEAASCDCGDGGGVLILAFVSVVLLAFIGIFLAMAMIVTWFQRVIQKYYQLREIRVLTQEYVVQDLSKLQPQVGPLSCEGLGISFIPRFGQPQQQSMDTSSFKSTNSPQTGQLSGHLSGHLSGPLSGVLPGPLSLLSLNPSAPNAGSLEWTVVPATSGAVQRSLTMDLQAVYGYQVS